MRFGTWNVRSQYKAGSLTAAAMELARHKLDLVGLQEVRRDKWAWQKQRIIFSKEKENHQLGTGFSVHLRTVSEVKTVVP